MLNLYCDWRKILEWYIFLAWNFRLYVMFGHSSPPGRESYGHVLGMYFYYSLCDLPDIGAFLAKLEKSFGLNSQQTFV